ncbi:MAG: methylmalonyl-CoA mutase [Candidatus Rokubacteria bacterium]|nr:methylmalonyl-CoA mutase [Candidatus Rokubacteria bacterium]
MFDEATIEAIQRAAGSWEAQDLATAAARYPLRPHRTTLSGIPVKPLYTPADVGGLDHERDVGFPGRYPFTRGPYAIGYLSRYWQARQYCGFGTGEATNQRLHQALRHGDTGLNVIIDLPTAYFGIDADDPRAEGEVGKTGVSVNSIEDMHAVFDGIPIERVSITFNTTSLTVLAMYFAMAEERGVPIERLRGSALNNPFASYASCNSGCLPAPEDALRELGDIMEFCVRHMPGWNPTSIGGYELREGGATAVQEVAFMFGNAIAYTEAFLRRGLRIDEVAPKYVFYFSLGNYFFEEVVKFRAARRIWARLARERFGATTPEAMTFRVHTQTSGLTLTAEQPLNNIVRTTLQSLAAVLGGTNSLYTDPYDEALCLPSELALRTAVRVQQIIFEESGVADTIDPLGGAYCVEALTNTFEARVWALLEEIERRGGMAAAIESGWVQGELERSARAYQEAVRRGERTVVGYNRYRVEDEVVDYGVFQVDPAQEEAQKARLRDLRARREPARVAEGLAALRAATREGTNLMRPCMGAAKARATFGEMTQTIYGELRPFRDTFLRLKQKIHAF